MSTSGPRALSSVEREVGTSWERRRFRGGLKSEAGAELLKELFSSLGLLGRSSVMAEESREGEKSPAKVRTFSSVSQVKQKN